MQLTQCNLETSKPPYVRNPSLTPAHIHILYGWWLQPTASYLIIFNVNLEKKYHIDWDYMNLMKYTNRYQAKT